ncbi:thermostable carboxypeptidase 1 [Scenedesmus sp. PABB004]|nr:thermostable carboxypeptidase 1 [Scenedesmus sp. PABB004]
MAAAALRRHALPRAAAAAAAATAPRRAATRRAASRAMAAAAAVESPAPDVTAAYGELVSKLRELDALSGINGLLGWDELVMMPEGAVGSRGAQKAALAGVLYDRRTEPALGALLDTLHGAPGLDAVQAAVVRDARKAYARETAIPKALAQRIAKLETDAYVAWVAARKASDFSAFAPFLQQWVDVSRAKAAAIDPAAPPYDVLLEDYEKGMTSDRLDAIFAEVRAGLVPLLAELRARGTPPDDSWLAGSYDVERQAALCKEIALALGFDTNNGRLDVSVHPFTGGSHPTDVRMTTRFKEGDLTEGLTGAVHETGHALYEQGRSLAAEWEGLPVNSALSMGVHESQSLLWERMVALSRPFARWLLPRVRSAFPAFPDRSAEEFYEALNVIKNPSLIRVESDEVTYSLHVILRYEIERGLIDGSIAVADVPRVWREKMVELLGAEPENDADGSLQDVHWSAGLFGYFATYSLGAMYACQIFETAKQHLPGLEDQIAAGDFKPLREWLRENIHTRGSLDASGDELMVAVTGSALQPQVFLDHLRTKYGQLYKL